MNNQYLNKITNADCLEHLANLDAESIDLFLSDIPYGIGLDDWDVLHNNTNSAYLGSSPAQAGKSGFKRRGKPINGWSSADRNIGKEYQAWCQKWTDLVFPKMKEGSSLFVFGARRTLHRVINAFEDSGFLLKDVLAWKKNSAHHRAARLTNVLEKRGLDKEVEEWQGWRLGNLAPIYEPIAWFIKPYKITITDNILKNGVGAINLEDCKLNGSSPTNLLEFGFASASVMRTFSHGEDRGSQHVERHVRHVVIDGPHASIRLETSYGWRGKVKTLREHQHAEQQDMMRAHAKEDTEATA